MASISKDPSGNRAVQFVGTDGKRRSVRLGKVSQRDAEEVKLRVERLASAQAANLAIDGETARWLAGVSDELHGRLVAVGLASPRQAVSDVALGQFLEDYREQRGDVCARTSVNYKTFADRLLAFFDTRRTLRSISEGDADRWLVFLKQKYAGATVSKSVKTARQFWAQAIRDGLASANPFAHLRLPSEVNTARAFFVDRPTFAQVLDACPDHEWRLLLALARYGGLRTPSEPLTLEWAGVNWSRERFRVVAPKTEHQDGGERMVPLFPELRPHLDEAFERAEPGTVHVIARLRDPAVNLRRDLLAILARAGVKPWPRLFQNLRSSRETELAETFPIHVVTEWLGNSPGTALAHYTQVTEGHYRRAVHNPVQQPAAPARTESQDGERRYSEGEALQEVATGCEPVRESCIIPLG